MPTPPFAYYSIQQLPTMVTWPTEKFYVTEITLKAVAKDSRTLFNKYKQQLGLGKETGGQDIARINLDEVKVRLAFNYAWAFDS